MKSILMSSGGGQFIRAIMIYYVLIYFIRKCACNYARQVVGIVFILSLCVYILWFPHKHEVSTQGIYGTSNLYIWLPYFAFMLIGADIGRRNKNIHGKGWLDFIKMLCSLIAFYGLQLMAKVYPETAPFQIVTLIPLVGIVVYLYKWCKSPFFYKIYQHTIIRKGVILISGLCLESYLIQFSLFSDKMNGIWPLNLVIITIVILVCSYLVRCMAHFFVQTFRTEDYDWKEIIKL